MSIQTIQDDDNNDIALADGRNIVLISGAFACSQSLRNKSLMRLGEDQYNIEDGVDYFGTVFTPQPDFDAARASITSNLLEVPDVQSLQSLTINVIGDVFTYTAEVNTIYGSLRIEINQSV
jgi:hypothetical protein